MIIIRKGGRDGVKGGKRKGRLKGRKEGEKDSELETLGEVIVCIFFNWLKAGQGKD